MTSPPRTATQMAITTPPRRKRRLYETAAPAPSVLSTPGDGRFIVQSLEINMESFAPTVRAQYRKLSHSHYLDLPIDRAMRAMAEEVFPQARGTRVWASVASPVSEGTCIRWAPCGGGRRIYAHELLNVEDTAEEPLPALREVLTMAREGDREGCSRAVMFGCAECPIHGASLPAAVAADGSVDDPMFKALFAIVGTELGGIDRLTALPSTVVRVELRDEDNATVATLTRGSRGGSPHLERGEGAAPVRAVALLAPPAPERTRPRSPCRALFVRAFEAPILRSRIWSAHSVEDAVQTWRKFSKLGGSNAIRPPIIEFDLCQKRLNETAKRPPLYENLLKHIASFIDVEAVLLGGLSARVESVFGLNKIQHRTIQFEEEAALVVDEVGGKAGKRQKIQKVDIVVEFNFETDTPNPHSFDASTLANLEAPTRISRKLSRRSAFSSRAIKT